MHACSPLLLRALLLGPLAAHAGWLIVDEKGEQTLLSRGRLKMAPKQAEGGPVLMLDVGRAPPVGRRCRGGAATGRHHRGILPGVRPMPPWQLAEREDLPPASASRSPDDEARWAAARRPPAPGSPSSATAETQTIAGLPTRKYRVLANGALYEELWLTSDAALLRELDLGRAPDTFGRMFACMATAGGGERVEATAEYRQLYAQGGR